MAKIAKNKELVLASKSRFKDTHAASVISRVLCGNETEAFVSCFSEYDTQFRISTDSDEYLSPQVKVEMKTIDEIASAIDTRSLLNNSEEYLLSNEKISHLIVPVEDEDFNWCLTNLIASKRIEKKIMKNPRLINWIGISYLPGQEEKWRIDWLDYEE